MKGHSWQLRGCPPIRSFTLLMNGHSTPPLFGRAMDWYEVPSAFHNRNTLGNFFKCFVICTSHYLIHGALILILELFMIKSIPTGALYVTLHIKIRWRKVKICGLSSGNWFFFCKFARTAEASKKRAPAREECNKYDRTAFPCFWLANIMIGAGGLLLVVPTYLQSMFQFIGGIAKK
jgi:hypothetical protein